MEKTGAGMEAANGDDVGGPERPRRSLVEKSRQRCLLRDGWSVHGQL